MTTQRLTSFTDGVIAVIITIMVLELPVPHAQPMATAMRQAPRRAPGMRGEGLARSTEFEPRDKDLRLTEPWPRRLTVPVATMSKSADHHMLACRSPP